MRGTDAYPMRYGHLEQMMEERGVSVAHSSINWWAIRFLPLIEKLSHKYKRNVGSNWRVDETYIMVKGRRNISTMLPTRRARVSTFF